MSWFFGAPDREPVQVLGDDHPATLSPASNLAVGLRGVGRVEEALRLDEDILARCRRVLGEDSPGTLATASHLANVLRGVGRVEEALRLDEDTLARRRRVLGDDHPDTLASANNLIRDRRLLGAAWRWRNRLRRPL